MIYLTWIENIIRVMKSKLMHYLTLVYFVNQPPHVLGIFVAHHIYTHTHTYIQNKYQLLYMYSIPPVLQISPKCVEVDWRNKLWINSASSWFSPHGCIEKHGQQNIKKKKTIYFHINLGGWKNTRELYGRNKYTRTETWKKNNINT